MSDYPMLISNKLHSFRNFSLQSYDEKAKKATSREVKAGESFAKRAFPLSNRELF